MTYCHKKKKCTGQQHLLRAVEPSQTTPKYIMGHTFRHLVPMTWSQSYMQSYYDIKTSIHYHFTYT